MPTNTHLPISAERASTDDSLRNERGRADDELARLDAALSKAAAAEVGVAREHADEKVRRSRRQADRKVVDPSADDLDAREAARKEEDDALRLERLQADLTGREEREA